MKKKTVVINTDLPTLKTGLARNGRLIAEHLYKTGKYNIVYFCCGVPWQLPDYQRFPWKTFGALPENPAETQELFKDPVRSRAISYGDYYIDRIIRENRADVLIVSNDGWSHDGWRDRIWWNKIHCISHTTIDSIPILRSILELIKKTPNFLVWADFAEKEAKRLGYNHVKTLTGAIDPKCFCKLSKNKKLELRKEFNLPENAFIVGYVFRNQLRKELCPLMEGFSTFCKNHPNVPAYLLLHTNYSEPGGWSVMDFASQFQIDPSKILATYVCKKCKKYEIKPFVGENQKCKYCGSEGNDGQITTNIQLGVTEQELNEIYNLMDCYPHLFNAAGLEYPIVEALCCELPVSTVPYASGEMFTAQDFVYSVDITFTVQHGTQFKRSVPNPYSVFKFLKRIHETSQDKRAEIGKRGREWALGKFSIDIIGKQWEDLIDSLPDHNWDYNFETPPKNPNAIIDYIEDDTEFIKQCYKKILNMDVTNDDSGLKYWLDFVNS